MEWTATDLAYLAGILDGEGTFTLSVTRPRTHVHYYPHVNIANTDMVLVRWITERFGGTVITIKPRSDRRINQSKTGYMVAFRKAEMLKLLPAVIPYLVIKRRQAEILLQYFNRYAGSRLQNPETGRWTYHPYSEEEKTLIIELRQLNHRG